MADFAKQNGIDYPIAIDVDKKTIAAFAVDSYPDYYLIDRQGNLRVADLANGELERVVKVLLAEKPIEAGALEAKASAPIASVLASASQIAVKKDKRILILWGSEEQGARLESRLKLGELRQLVFNEYEVVHLERDSHAQLARAFKAGAHGASLSVLDAQGSYLAQLGERYAAGKDLVTFLEANRVPAKDAEQLWKNAKAQAQREKKNILVHLGAPW